MIETVLVVDDDGSIRELLQQMLKGAGYDVVTASDGNQALELVAAKNPALVLLDIKLPGKSGMEVLQELKTNHPDTAVIMATAVGDVNVAINALRKGAYDYLSKPFNVHELIISVARALERQRLIRQNRDYQLNLEQKVAEQTRVLEQKIRELTALNNLFASYLNQGFETAETYGHLASNIIKMAEEIKTMAKDAEARCNC